MKHMSIEAFGRQLITSGDLDPVYIGLTGTKMTTTQLKRWLVAYWCYYSAGVACWLSEHRDQRYWDHMMTAAANEQPTPLGGRWPRSAERRHFRGKQAIDAVSDLAGRYPKPEAMVDYVSEPAPSFTGVYERSREHRGYGPWISFKIADMLDRCLGIPVSFDEAAVFMFKDPALAVDMLWEKRIAPITKTKIGAGERRTRVVANLMKEFADLKAPPLYDRPINIQEIETSLCKWKSHLNGHYPPGKDIHEVREGLALWTPHSETAARMLAAMPDALTH
jgi:hypothetical protein